ncbi:MAG: HEPN domain-containing protein [Desulfurococcales archaeon]|nr:HEPN domain-containing protein [Desulfurococcales archaeon]
MGSGVVKRMESAWRSLKSVKHDINNGFYEWATIKSYKASEAALCAVLDVDLDAYHVHKLSDLYRMAAARCGGEDDVMHCVSYVESVYSTCFTSERDAESKCDLVTTISSFRCSRMILSWAQRCLSQGEHPD